SNPPANNNPHGDSRSPSHSEPPSEVADERGGLQQVLSAEVEQIGRRRKHAWGQQGGDARAVQDIVGLSISGGGIRSATFGLGALQGLASMGVLRCVDYLSTVSGGGYIGSWFAAWVRRTGDPDKVIRQLDPCLRRSGQGSASVKNDTAVTEPGPIRHLREFSNYLTPRKSVFSADSWTLIAIYLRNLLANQLCLLPVILLALLLTRFAALLFIPEVAAATPLLKFIWIVPCLAVPAAFGFVGMSLADVREPDSQKHWKQPPGFSQKCSAIIMLLVIAAPFVTWLMTPAIDRASETLIDRFPHWKLLTGRPLSTLREANQNDLLTFVVLFALLHLAPVSFRMCRNYTEIVVSYGATALAVFGSWWLQPNLHWVCHLGIGAGVLTVLMTCSTSKSSDNWRDRLRQTFATIVSGAVGGGLLYALLQQFLWKHPENPALIVTLGPSALLAIVGLSANMETVLTGRVATEEEREWWGRISAWCLISAVTWALIFGIALFGGLWLLYLGAWARTTVTAGWLLSGFAGIAAGRSGKIAGGNSPKMMDRAVVFAPYVFLVGLLCLMSLAAHKLVTRNPPVLNSATAPADGDGVVRVVLETDGTAAPKITAERKRQAEVDLFAKYLAVIRYPDLQWMFWACVICIAIAVVANMFVEVNEFSLNASDANRLTRCYLGASRLDESDNVRRNPNDMTGFDPLDDLPLSDLKICEEPPSENGKTSPLYRGPYPIINTALNLVAGDNLAWQERKSESFILTPLWFGSSSLGYRKWRFQNEGLTRNGLLGRAVAVSGAAVNPNMGYHSSPAITALMTLFNVRTGWWFPNPGLPGSDINERPRSLLKWLLIELFGFTNGKRK
ncbi:MAG: patatin-like phospholipase family protein, partial [Planctomycetaceae bacterium]|nr:patatin-like phospholipase family protein [Planctomycetaceae bacterium]